MQDQSDTQAGVTPRPGLHDEFTRSPRPTMRARFSMVGFGLLLVASLVIPALSTTEAMPGISLVALGMFLVLGVAELMDAGQRRFVIAVRASGFVIALLGFVIQLVTR